MNWVTTRRAIPGGPGGGGPILPADRLATANWQMAGMQSVGGIPNRTTVFTTVSPIGGGTNDRPAIQAAINACPANQVVQLSAGTFTINDGTAIQMGPMVLRGAGPKLTILNKPNGATMGSPSPGSSPSALIETNGFPGSGITVSLTSDAAQGSYSIQVSDASGYHVGEIVLLDEASGAAWQPDTVDVNTGQIWAAPDYRVVWQLHNPSIPGDDGGDIFTFFQIHADHPTNELKQISNISGNTITFDSPMTISYRVSHGAQIASIIDHSVQVGIEELAVTGGDDGNIKFQNISYSWLRHVESSGYLNDGVRIQSSFRLELAQCYFHEPVWPFPGGAGYNISLAFGSSEVLIHDSVSVKANKVMVARACGAGSVVAYCYMDMGFIKEQDTWAEIGLNASHLVGPHHVLFEGNWGWNADSDQTHGNSIYITHFRNLLTGFRTSFTDYVGGGTIDDTLGAAPLRAAGAHAYAYWHSFVGCVLGTSGLMSGWVENATSTLNTLPPPAIWTLGVVDISPQGHDPVVETTTIRDGNYDFVTNSQKWFNTPGRFTIPNSLYLTSVPSFFSGNTWPWVDPSTGTTYTLPAKHRYDIGAP